MIEFDLNLFLYQLVCFSIFAVLIYLFAFRKIVQFVRQRQTKLKEDLDAAEESRDKAEEYKQEYYDKIAGIEEEVGEIIRKANEAAGKKREELIANAEKEADAIVKRGENIVAQEERRAISAIKGDVAEMAVMIAGKVLDETRTDERENNLAVAFLKDLDERGEIEIGEK
ncbi:MAG: F0F1 ATP synthase subunit B [bacterium]|nr:F0F1 ATP synthase subunit B [bacterium]